MREIKLHNSLSGKVDLLERHIEGQVGIYACGPTVYSRIHVGNARPFVLFALMKRFFEHEGLKVTLVENITDVNDKIYAAAAEQGMPSAELAGKMARAYIEDTDRLELGRPDHEPLASETMAAIIDLIEALIDGQHAYAAEGDVYFRVRSFAGYGKLSNRIVDEMESQEPGELKEDPLDFALWKAQKPGEDTAWDAPWGRGRPGWHIECSAMAETILGLEFDIHGGGSDLIFPHHENEIAQTEAARGRSLARIWVHNGMVRFGEEKMAKSVGNIELLAGVLDRYGRDALVMFFLGGHYRQPLVFTDTRLKQARAQIERVEDFIRLTSKKEARGEGPPEWATAHIERFFDALADDFNTPEALAGLFKLVSEGNKMAETGMDPGLVPGHLHGPLYCIGLEGLLAAGQVEADADVMRLVHERESAREEGHFDEADRARAEIERLGYTVRDTDEGPELVPKS